MCLGTALCSTAQAARSDGLSHPAAAWLCGAALRIARRLYCLSTVRFFGHRVSQALKPAALRFEALHDKVGHRGDRQVLAIVAASDQPDLFCGRTCASRQMTRSGSFCPMKCGRRAIPEPALAAAAWERTGADSARIRTEYSGKRDRPTRRGRCERDRHPTDRPSRLKQVKRGSPRLVCIIVRADKQMAPVWGAPGVVRACRGALGDGRQAGAAKGFHPSRRANQIAAAPPRLTERPNARPAQCASEPVTGNGAPH